MLAIMWMHTLPNLRYYHCIFLKGLRKTMIDCQDNWYLGHNLNWNPTYKARMETTWLWYLVFSCRCGVLSCQSEKWFRNIKRHN
jgi:hypothetical protein